MNGKRFNELLESVQEALAISKGKREPCRMHHIDSADPKPFGKRRKIYRKSKNFFVGKWAKIKMKKKLNS